MGDSNLPNGEDKKKTRVSRKPKPDSILTPTFAASRLSTSSVWNDRDLPSGSFLQRQCACGTHTIGGGECDSCQRKPEAGNWRHTAINALPNEAESFDASGVQTFPESSVAWDFSRVPAHTIAPNFSQVPGSRVIRQSEPDIQPKLLFGAIPQNYISTYPKHLAKKSGERDMRGEGGEDEVDDRKGVLSGALIGAGAGALTGAAIGSFVPGIGTGIGALVGGAVGAIGGGIAGHLLSCQASATGVSLGASGPINDGRKYGLRTPITVRGTQLADVLDSELVGTSIDHTGSMAARPSARSNNSGFMPADNIPDDRHTSSISDHLSYFDNHGGDGSYSRLQMDLFKIPKCKINTPQAMPNSGYRIKRTVKAEGTKVVGIVTKTAEDVTIGSYKTTKGLTAKKEAKVTLRA